MNKNSLMIIPLIISLTWLSFGTVMAADALVVGQQAPNFELMDQDGNRVSLAARQGQGWTVLYFYPKAGTPGCTTEACAFRDAIQSIRNLNAEVYGISTDEVKSLLAFHQKHKLKFSLLADPDAKVTSAYGVKLPILQMAKRWTFLLDPNLIIRQIDEDVDPAMHAQTVAEQLKQLQVQP